MIPEWLEPAAFVVKAAMNAKTFSPFFPELAQYGTRRIDLRCNADLQSLKDGDLEEVQMSSIRFKDGNRVDVDLHLGCAVWLYKESVEIPLIQDFMNFIVDLYDEDEEKWEKHRSVYISMRTMIELDFDESAKKFDFDFDWVNTLAKQWGHNGELIKIPKMSEHTPLFWGRVKNFKPEIHELKVFEGKYEIHDEAQ